MRGTPPINLKKCKTAYWRISYIRCQAQFIFIMKLKAKLKHPIQVNRQDGIVEKLDRRTALTYLDKHKKDVDMNIGFVLENFTEAVRVELGCLKMNLIGYAKLRLAFRNITANGKL